jgi:hypothetical protein
MVLVIARRRPDLVRGGQEKTPKREQENKSRIPRDLVRKLA